MRPAVPADLLGRLDEEFLCSVSLVARAVGIPPQVLRKWRHGEEPTDAQRLRLSRLLGTLELLSGMGIEAPASWLERRIWGAVPVRRVDVLAAEQGDCLLAYASGQSDALELLNAVVPQWQELYPIERSEVTFGGGRCGMVHVAQ